MAGSGQRFKDAGYEIAKPLLPVHGRAMFEIVLLNLVGPSVHSFTLVARAEWNLTKRVEAFAKELQIPIRLVEVTETTGGPAETVLLTEHLLSPDLPVTTANSDQYVDTSMEAFYQTLQSPACDGLILTMKDSDPKWSYAATDELGCVSRVAEKEVISHDATVGIYGFSSASLMFGAIHSMIAARDRVNNEYYVGPAYNYLIAQGGTVQIVDLGPINSVMHGMGIPEDYVRFLNSPVSLAAASSSELNK